MIDWFIGGFVFFIKAFALLSAISAIAIVLLWIKEKWL